MKRNQKYYNEVQVEQLLDRVLKSSKYKYVCEDTIRNIGIKELSNGRRLKEAIKATKNKLHQIGGSYFYGKPKYDYWIKELKKAKTVDNKDTFQSINVEIMKHHSSTKERLGILNQFYVDIFSHLPPINSIIDIACGLNPLSIPWMPISSHNVEYIAYDIYKDLIAFLSDFMRISNFSGHAEVRDVLYNPPQIKADLAFILKIIPCFDQIDNSANSQILDKINANYIVLSFPVKSLGGKEKMMIKNYTNRFNELVQDRDWKTKRIVFETELIFIIDKKEDKNEKENTQNNHK